MHRVSALLKAESRSIIGRNRPSIALVVALVSVLLIIQAVIGAGLTPYAKTAPSKSALSLIELSGVTTQARKNLTPKSLATVEEDPGVSGVYPWWQRDLAFADATDWPSSNTNPGAVWATPVIPGLEPRLIAGHLDNGGVARGEVILPHSVPGGELDKLLGKTVDLEYTKVTGAGTGEPATIPLTVVGIADNSVPGRDGPTPAYVSEDDLITASGGTAPASFTTAFAKASSSQHVPKIQSELASQGFAVSSLASQMTELGGLFSVIRSASWVLIAVLAAVSLIVGAVVGSIWVKQRYNEVGTLKAIGWSRPMIAGAVTGELLLVGFVSALLGIAIGCVGSLIATTVVSNANLVLLPVAAFQLPPWQSLVISLVAVPMFVVLGGYPQARRASTLDPDAVMRS